MKAIKTNYETEYINCCTDGKRPTMILVTNFPLLKIHHQIAVSYSDEFLLKASHCGRWKIKWKDEVKKNINMRN